MRSRIGEFERDVRDGVYERRENPGPFVGVVIPATIKPVFGVVSGRRCVAGLDPVNAKFPLSSLPGVCGGYYGAGKSCEDSIC